MKSVPASKVQPQKDQAPKRRAYLPAAERKKSIIAAAQQVFARSTLQGARTRDIAKAAEVNQATIFEHFASKEALFQEAVVQPLIEAMRGMYERMEVYETAATPDELARLALASATRHVDDMIEIFPLFTAALFSDPALGRTLYQEHLAPLLRERGEVLKGVAREGLDLDFVGRAIFGMLFSIALDAHYGAREDGREPDPAHLARQFTRLATSGFARDAAQMHPAEPRGKDDDSRA